MMRRSRFATLLVLALFIAGCTVGPNYRRPAADAPIAYRGDSTAGAAAASPESIGDAKWWTVFQDEQLQALIRTAVQQNFDARIAATRVLEAQAQFGITRADQFPTVSAGADLNATRNAKNPLFGPFQVNTGEVTLSAAWEIDFWGKYRRATEAARANLLASEWGRRAVVSTLVSDVAAAYFQLRSLDSELEISKSTLASRQNSLKLEQALEKNGSISLVDVRQSEQLVYTAAETVPDLERRIQEQENLIKNLLGENPGSVPRGLPLIEQPHAPAVPVGLPSALLERRPDIRQAEQNLIAANARIGVARADYFPNISLTGTGGFQSDALSRLFSGPAGLWNYGPTLTQPIFTAGKIRSNVKLAEAQHQEELLTYQQTIQQAFRDVSDSLIAYQKDREFREQQELLAISAQDATRLAEIRYKNGISSYLEVLANETNSFSAELNLAQARLNELTDLVHLYNALGGGWEQ
jgi:outer membrane protein, multidrug efflux system